MKLEQPRNERIAKLLEISSGRVGEIFEMDGVEVDSVGSAQQILSSDFSTPEQKQRATEFYRVASLARIANEGSSRRFQECLHHVNLRDEVVYTAASEALICSAQKPQDLKCYLLDRNTAEKVFELHKKSVRRAVLDRFCTEILPTIAFWKEFEFAGTEEETELLEKTCELWKQNIEGADPKIPNLVIDGSIIGHPMRREFFLFFLRTLTTSWDLERVMNYYSRELESVSKSRPESYAPESERRLWEENINFLNWAIQLVSAKWDETLSQESQTLEEEKPLLEQYDKAFKFKLQKTKGVICGKLQALVALKLEVVTELDFVETMRYFGICRTLYQSLEDQSVVSWFEAVLVKSTTIELANQLVMEMKFNERNPLCEKALSHWVSFNPDLSVIIKLAREYYRFLNSKALVDSLYGKCINIDCTLSVLALFGANSSTTNEKKTAKTFLDLVFDQTSELASGLVVLAEACRLMSDEDLIGYLQRVLMYATSEHAIKLVIGVLKQWTKMHLEPVQKALVLRANEVL